MNRTLSLTLLAVALLLAFAAPMWLGRYGNNLMSLWLVTAVAALGVNLIMGYAGQETLAQAGFMGIGAYTTALMIKGGTLSLSLPFVATPIALAWEPFSMLTAMAASGILAFLFGLLIGFPALRVQKHYLAFVTLAFSVFLWLVFRNEEWLTGGVFGIQDIKRPTILGIEMSPSRRLPHRYTYFILIATLVLTAAMWWLVKSPWGRAFTALRENAVRAESLGVDVRGYTLIAFAIGSAYGGLAGSLFAPLVEFIDPNPFLLEKSLLFLLMIVVGGMGYFFGPFIGAGVAVLLPLWIETFQSSLVSAGYKWAQHGSYLLVYGVLVIVMIAFMPRGFAGAIDSLLKPKRRPHADSKDATLSGAKP
ncbi:MAG: branched-chain amino acid ABC transporter permease [Beijerinckiaceae bacterium]